MYVFMYYCVEGTFVIGWAPWGRSGWVGSFKSGCLPPVVSSGKATLDSSSGGGGGGRRRHTEETHRGDITGRERIIKFEAAADTRPGTPHQVCATFSRSHC